MLVEDGIRIIKFYMSISKEEQANRIKATEKNPLRKWEVTDVDRNALALWNKYTRHKNKMLKNNLVEYEQKSMKDILILSIGCLITPCQPEYMLKNGSIVSMSAIKHLRITGQL